MKYKKYFFSLLFLLLSLISIKGKSQCKQKNSLTSEPITKISYSRCCGGEADSYENFIISKDSIIYEEGVHNLRNRYRKVYRDVTPISLWDSLKRAINIFEFDKIKSNKSNAERDGSDIKVTIKKGNKVYSVVNADFDKINGTQSNLLMKLIDHQLFVFWKKAINE